MGDQNRRMSLQNVRLPSNLLKEIDIERMGKLTEDEGEFTEFLDGLDLEDVRRTNDFSVTIYYLYSGISLLITYTVDCK